MTGYSFFERTRLLNLLRHICVFFQHPKSSPLLYTASMLILQSLGDKASSGFISCMNKARTLKTSVTMICDFVLAQLLTECDKFCRLNFSHMVWVRL